MQALFIGQTYIDVTLIADRIPTGDDKDVARDYAVSFGGNAVTAAFCCARLGIVPDLLTSLADDWLGRMFLDMAAKYQVSVHGRKVQRSSLSFVMPQGRQARHPALPATTDYLHPFPPLNLDGCRALHLDGHMADAAIHYAKSLPRGRHPDLARRRGLRSNTIELLAFIDVAVVSERFCEQLNMSPAALLELLQGQGCKIGGVTQGERGILWYDERGAVQHHAGARRSAREIVDTNGAGDVFHGAYVYSYLARPELSWDAHFRFARAASAHAIRFLGNEARLPTFADVESAERRFQPVGCGTA